LKNVLIVKTLIILLILLNFMS